METDKRLVAAFDSVINIDAKTVQECETEPERTQLKMLADTMDIEKVRKALKIMNSGKK